MKKLLNQLGPFIFMGIAVVAFVFGLMILAYLFLFGAVTGIILFTISWIKGNFLRQKNIVKRPSQPGRIIDTDEWKKL